MALKPLSTPSTMSLPFSGEELREVDGEPNLGKMARLMGET